MGECREWVCGRHRLTLVGGAWAHPPHPPPRTCLTGLSLPMRKPAMPQHLLQQATLHEHARCICNSRRRSMGLPRMDWPMERSFTVGHRGKWLDSDRQMDLDLSRHSSRAAKLLCSACSARCDAPALHRPAGCGAGPQKPLPLVCAPDANGRRQRQGQRLAAWPPGCSLRAPRPAAPRRRAGPLASMHGHTRRRRGPRQGAAAGLAAAATAEPPPAAPLGTSFDARMNSAVPVSASK
jgi:hypothetical protein